MPISQTKTTYKRHKKKNVLADNNYLGYLKLAKTE